MRALKIPRRSLRSVRPSNGRALMSTTISSSASNKQASGGAYTADQYERNPDHVANTGRNDEDSYVLTLLTDKEHHNYMTALRTRYFPPSINKLAAHIALFRALPGSELPRITSDLGDVSGRQRPFKVIADRPFALRAGIGINVQADEAKSLYNELRERWRPFLSKQDSGSFKAHYTVQNKVEDKDKVSKDLKQLSKEFEKSEGEVVGLSLYKYVRGFWKDRRDFMFSESQ